MGEGPEWYQGAPKHYTHRVVYVMCNTATEEDKTRGGEEKVVSSLLHLCYKLSDLLEGTETMLGKEGGREGGRKGEGEYTVSGELGTT